MWQKTKIALITVVLVVLTICTTWLGSGSISPYASTFSRAEFDSCGYLYNIDHNQFFCTFRMLRGDPRDQWTGSVVLRRILYPILAYPSMQKWGFEFGGFITNTILAAITSLTLVVFLLRRFGERAALTGGLLFATYPGLAYFGGLPYSYFFIAPASIVALIILNWLASAPTLVRAILAGLFLGILTTGYDLLPLFLPTTIIVLAVQKKFLPIPFALGAMVAPPALVMWYQTNVMRINPLNSNTEVYTIILNALLNPSKTDYQRWFELLWDAPGVLIHNFTFSTFFALPITFLLVYLAARRDIVARLSPPEWGFLLAAAVLWCVNNFAPPYHGWQMRGTWYARIYQPVFAVYIFYLARIVSLIPRNSVALRRVLMIVVSCVLLQMTIVVAPVLGVYRLSGQIYHEFYQHATAGFFEVHMKIWGARPRGFCKGR